MKCKRCRVMESKSVRRHENFVKRDKLKIKKSDLNEIIREVLKEEQLTWHERFDPHEFNQTSVRVLEKINKQLGAWSLKSAKDKRHVQMLDQAQDLIEDVINELS